MTEFDTLTNAAARFLSRQRFAVVGVSRAGDAPANVIYRRLKETGRDVVAVNPNAERVEGDPCYASLQALPKPVDAVIVATHPGESLQVARDCRETGVGYVWFHRSFGTGSVSEEAVAHCHEYGACVIPSGCPMMHLTPIDFGHRCMRAVLRLTGRLPERVACPRSPLTTTPR